MSELHIPPEAGIKSVLAFKKGVLRELHRTGKISLPQLNELMGMQQARCDQALKKLREKTECRDDS